MNLKTADKVIKACIDKMNAIYHRPVFDEWAVVAHAAEKGLVLAYEGPRVEQAHGGFIEDLSYIMSEMKSGRYSDGDFVFARDADSTSFDAFIVLGNGIFLICNNTGKTMEEITKDPLWLQAQVPFVNLSNRFSMDPVEMPN